MEKRLIISMAVGDKSRKYSEITFPLIQKYAQKCGADFHAVYTVNLKYDRIGYQKWDYVKFLGQYDRILHIDADMIVRSTTPNLFDVVPSDCFAGVDEYPFQDLSIEEPKIDRFNDMKAFRKIMGDGFFVFNFYINVGLYMFSKNHNWIFNSTIDNQCFFKEQTEINYNLNCLPNRVHLLPPQYNFMSLMEHKGLSKEDAYIIHYAGNWFGKSDEEVMKMMKEDIR